MHTEDQYRYHMVIRVRNKKCDVSAHGGQAITELQEQELVIMMFSLLFLEWHLGYWRNNGVY